MKDLEPLWKIEDELTALVDSVDTCPDHLKPELEARIAQYLASFCRKTIDNESIMVKGAGDLPF